MTAYYNRFDPSKRDGLSFCLFLAVVFSLRKLLNYSQCLFIETVVLGTFCLGLDTLSTVARSALMMLKPRPT